MDDTSTEGFELPESEEIDFLDYAIAQTEKVNEELEDCLKTLLSLQDDILKTPRKSFLLEISPGNSWKDSEYLHYTIDSLINEERQKLDSQQPQQHHNDINDASLCSVSSEAFSDIINQISEVASDSTFDAGGGGDNAMSSLLEEVVSQELDFLNRHSKLHCKRIRARLALESTLASFRLAISRGADSALKCPRYKITRFKPNVTFSRTQAGSLSRPRTL